MKNIVKLYLLLVMFSGASVFAQTTTKIQSALVSVGMQSPNFSYEISKGKKGKINDLKGKVVLINFFATWCSPCRVELPKIQSEIWNKHQGNPGFAMLTFGREHTWDEVNQFKKEQGFLFPFFPDPKRGVYGLFATQTIPRSFLLDTDGKIIYMSEGFDEDHFDELVKLIDSKL